MVTRRVRQARASSNPRIIANVAAYLAEHWDPEGRYATPTGDRTAEAHAQVLVGIVAAGGAELQLTEYLAWAEAAAGGGPATNGGEHEVLALAIRRRALGLDDPGAPPPPVV